MRDVILYISLAINVVSMFAFILSLGIVVDDTVHFLSKYIRARREKGYSAEDAVRYGAVIQAMDLCRAAGLANVSPVLGTSP